MSTYGPPPYSSGLGAGGYGPLASGYSYGGAQYNVTDRAGSVGFPTDINAINSSAAVNAGSSSLRTVNITGGVAGVPLTLFSTGGADAAPLGVEADGIITGVANSAVRINSAFLGNLVADIDAARNGSAAGPEGSYGTTPVWAPTA